MQKLGSGLRFFDSQQEPLTSRRRAECCGARKETIIGNPDLDKCSTSHIERHNLSVRMENRRFTILTNAFSKRWANHRAALALYFAYYNFCRMHKTLRCTPAMAAGIVKHVWTLRDLLEATAGV
jgi:hypothetical protein